MKKLSYLLSALVLVAILATVGCKKDDGPGLSPQDQVGQKFAGTWTVDATAANSVTFNTTDDRTADYSAFTLTITYDATTGSGTYAATGGQTGASPWPSSGTWTFNGDITDANATFMVTRDDGLDITVTSLTETDLSFTFTFDSGTHSGSRVMAVDGSWSFSMVGQ